MSLNKKEQAQDTSSHVSRRQVLIGLLTAIGASSVSANMLAVDSILSQGATSNPLASMTFYSAKQFALINRLADLIIPDTNTKGALAVGVPSLMDSLYANWAAENSQLKHKLAIAAVHKQLNTLAKSEFLDLAKPLQIASLQTLDNMAFSNQAQHLYVYRDIKMLIARFYYLSEEGARKELRYEAVPGRWDSCVDLDEVGRTWAV